MEREEREALEKARKWMLAYEAYQEAFGRHMEQSTVDEDMASWEDMGNKLRKADADNSSHLITLLRYDLSEDEISYIYQAAARYLSEKDPKDLSFENVKLSGMDPVDIGSSIVKTVWGGFCDKSCRGDGRCHNKLRQRIDEAGKARH